jgi:hypothetical protein
MSGLILIDCVNLRLCYALKQNEKIALSYVWAKPVPGSTADPGIPTIDRKV